MSVLLILLISSIMMNSFYTVDAKPVALSEPKSGNDDATIRWCKIHKGCGGPDYPDKELREACLAIYEKKCTKYDE